MTNRTLHKKILSMVIASLAIPAVAQESRTLEEVTVTAQKRVESLQDVPISVSAVSGDKLADAGIEKIADITAYVPNMHMTESGISTQLRIRGIGSGNNQGFEQSVGQYVDGVYYGRQQLIRAPFLDLERVEVLRGPQPTLFGKNSIAGALNMTTAKPTEEFEGSIRAAYTPEVGGTELTGVVSGEIAENLLGRLAYRNHQQDGYIENTFTGDDEPNLDEQAIRATLLWSPTPDLDITFKAERDTFDVSGRQIEIVQDDVYSATMQAFGQPGFESRIDGKRQADGGDFSKNNLSNYTLTADYQLGENTLTAISSWVAYDFDELCDCDYIAADIFTVPMSEDYEQFSQEIRITSPGGETVDWIGGIFYQTSDQEFRDAINVQTTSVVVPALTVLGVPPQAAVQIGGTAAARVFEQGSDAWAAFGQFTWNIDDSNRLTVGGRYTREDKDGSRVLNATMIDGSPLGAANAAAAALYYGVFAVQSEQFNPDGLGGNLGHNLSGDRQESAFTPLISYQYDLDENAMLYASFTSGFKAGGFDARANNINSFEFDEEEATAFEAGAKTRFADGRAEFNIAVYRTEYDDLQISQFDGTLGFNVGNARETVVQGIELDGRWLMTDSLTVSYAASLLDFNYEDFENGNCYAGQVPDGVIAPWGVQLCDYTGKAGQYTPELTFNAGIEHNLPLNGDLELNSALDLQFVDAHNVHPNLDPQYRIDAYTTINARLALDSDSWSVALVGKNLTDEDIITYAGNAPLSGTFGASTYYAFLKPPRTLALEGAFRF
ncbi:TonB-dependent receptor [Biformimicrobium ophioploci]|uniref:TonB-dependent receptor n=1 Tax=Biformimicrobium ophioploci TaxID=3036711 RepID=A0ABQ6M2M3_9GAMM|nr:TonB-dependent receptor [Microbulbifer sp. NKW57]GMG88522.1 TonB-dependent receptor [Microbulbifer sp. NKW57]